MWGLLSQMLHGIAANDIDVLVDLGRDGAFGPSEVLARQADVMVLVVRTTMPMIRDAVRRLEQLEEHCRRVRVVLIEEDYPDAYVVQELRKAAGVRVDLLGTLPLARREAEVFSKGVDMPRGFARSKLMLAAGSLAAGLKQELLQASPPGRPPMARAEVGRAR
ncbi:hypothetical protein FNX44_023590 [Streptomyces sp. OF1]|uniref:Uncharacterized protein n=1 Tax=Streptomyces alkaliterrae TaxID=2213162 RepID=A0A5P0YWY3_9ACTN|nr:hypothetical protein [Streptomyces alkaliterrae]